MNTAEDILSHIENMAAEKEWSEDRLAEESGVNRNTLHDLLLYRHAPATAHFVKIYAALGVKILPELQGASGEKVIARINELLKKKGWDLPQLYKNTDLKQSSISYMYVHKSVPTLNTLMKLCDAFELSVEDFFTGSNDWKIEKEVKAPEVKCETSPHFNLQIEKSAVKNILGRIDYLCELKGWSRKELSEKSSVPRSTVNNMFYYDYLPSVKNLAKIYKVLGITKIEKLLDPDAEDIINRVYELLDKKGWNHMQLCRRIESPSLRQTFTNATMFEIHNLIKICDALDISIEDFFSGEHDDMVYPDESLVIDIYGKVRDRFLCNMEEAMFGGMKIFDVRMKKAKDERHTRYYRQLKYLKSKANHVWEEDDLNGR